MARLPLNSFTTPQELNDWFEDFLRIEAAGWKGAAGTALSKKKNHEQAFRNFASAAFDQGQLQFSRLSAGERPIAYAIDVLAGRGAFALKIAHDPAFHRYSPGVLLEAELLKRSLLNPEIDWVDSCASSSHSVLNTLWGETMPFTDVFISRSSVTSKITMLTAAAQFISQSAMRFACKEIKSERRYQGQTQSDLPNEPPLRPEARTLNADMGLTQG